MRVPFHKYEGTGNDFIITEVALSPAEVIKLCERRRGIGADGVLWVSEIDRDAQRVRMVLINADGTRPEMCGNGVRCVAQYVVDNYDFDSELIVESDVGGKVCHVESSGKESWVVVNMGFATIENEVLIDADVVAIPVSVGNPHAVVFDRKDDFSLDSLGYALNHNSEIFQKGVNLEFVSREGSALRVVVYERGVGRTDACGTGACAVAAAAWQNQYVGEGQVEVRLPGGELFFEKKEDGIWMRGNVSFVYRGAVDV